TTDVQMFPAAIFGGSQAGTWTSGSGLPMSVSSILSGGNLCTGFHTNALTTSGDFAATYDIYFSNGASSSQAGEPEVFLMIWLYKNGDMNPTNNLTPSGNDGDNTCEADAPVGITACPVSGLSNVEIDGSTFSVIRGVQHNGKTVITYALRNFRNNIDIDLAQIIQHAVDNNLGITTSMSLWSVQAGFEILSGGSGMKVSNFYVE
ncbi:MAG: hypothetical protein JXX29_22230, partial [Deltaproteobacteria bacterium]|nr:hypothetical protein [Deltaproteobacteria bacterium]